MDRNPSKIAWSKWLGQEQPYGLLVCAVLCFNSSRLGSGLCFSPSHTGFESRLRPSRRSPVQRSRLPLPRPVQEKGVCWCCLRLIQCLLDSSLRLTCREASKTCQQQQQHAAKRLCLPNLYNDDSPHGRHDACTRKNCFGHEIQSLL